MYTLYYWRSCNIVTALHNDKPIYIKHYKELKMNYIPNPSCPLPSISRDAADSEGHDRMSTPALVSILGTYVDVLSAMSLLTRIG